MGSRRIRSWPDERIVPLDAVAEVRLRGLMCGIELVPGDRHGRKVCAAAVARGVLLRPIGDVVIIVPPLTITTRDKPAWRKE